MGVFIDWVTGRLPLSCAHGINGGQVVSLSRHGEVEYRLDRGLDVEGSHSSNMRVRTKGETLEFAGNPTKWLQGHNVFGTADLTGLVVETGLELCRRLELPVGAGDLARWLVGDVQLTRLDVTRQYRLPGNVPAWLAVLAGGVHGGHQRVTNRGAFEGNTVYVGQHSRRVSLKMYDKAAELRRHTLPVTMDPGTVAQLQDYVRDVLRCEVTVRSTELQSRGRRRVRDWSESAMSALVDERLGKLTMLDNLALSHEEVCELPPRLLGVYEAWKAGHDLRDHYGRRQFYRYRRALLDYGIDIMRVRPRIVEAAPVYPLGRPLRSFLQGPGLEVPSWAEGTRLLACS